MTAELQLLTAASKAYGSPRDAVRKEVLRDVYFAVQAGRCTAVIAPNGSGKSTLARAILGAERLDSGDRAQLGAHDLRSAVLQDYRSLLLPHATLRTNLAFPFRRVEKPGPRVSAALEYLAALDYDLPLGRIVGQLSGGQQQAIVVARALAAAGSVMIWDEATSAMDYRRRRLLYELLWREWSRPDAPTVVLITHDVDEALLLADEILVLDTELVVVSRVGVEAPMAERTVSVLRSEEFMEAREGVRQVMLAEPVR